MVRAGQGSSRAGGQSLAPKFTSLAAAVSGPWLYIFRFVAGLILIFPTSSDEKLLLLG